MRWRNAFCVDPPSAAVATKRRDNRQLRHSFRHLPLRYAGVHVPEILVSLHERGGVDLVHGVGCVLFSQCDTAHDQRQIVCGDIFGVWETFFVQVFNQILAFM